MQQYGVSNNLTVQLAGPYGGSGGAAVKLTGITLPVSGWKGAVSPYFQVVEVEGVSVNSKVDLQPDPQQLEQFRQMDLAFVAENDGGVVTVYAIGDKPRGDCALQATVTEVIA